MRTGTALVKFLRALSASGSDRRRRRGGPRLDSRAGRQPPGSLRESVPGLLATMRYLRPYMAGHWMLLLAGSTTLLAEILLRLLEPWPLKFIFDRVIVPGPSQRPTGVAFADRMDPTLLLVLSAAALVAFIGLRALASYLSTVAFALAGNRVLTEVRADLYRHLQGLSLSFHTRARTGDLLTRVTGDVGRLQEVAVTAALPLTVNVTTLLGMVAVMLWMNWQLTLIALSAFPLFFLTMQRLTRRIRTVAQHQRRTEGALASLAAESLGAIEVVQAYSLEKRFEEAFTSQNKRNLKDGVKAKRLAAGLERKTDLLIALATGAALLFGARFVLRGALTPGDLIVFITYLKNAFKPMRDMAKHAGRLAQASASGERILDVLETVPDIQDADRAMKAPAFAGEIRFEHVTLAYSGRPEVLIDLNLRIRPGQTVALVGESGAGKSTIAGLLLRLYDPDQGRVLIDGTDIRELTLDSVRGQIGIVLQDSVLFATTIRENIGYGAPAATDRDVEAAARVANAHNFITALPDGYDTVVGERGVTLSGGERQRIAIARAAIRRAPIIILDEPTRGLDPENEWEVLEALRRLAAARTTLHVAHALHTVQDADLILYLEGGRVAETGTHEQLMGARGRYWSMYSSQGRSRSIRRLGNGGQMHAQPG